MEIIYFNDDTETKIEFNDDDIKKETFRADILRIGALKNPIHAKELFAQMDDSELEMLLIELQYKPQSVVNYFFIKEDSKQNYFLTINQLMEEVIFIGKNENSSLVKIKNSQKGIFHASNNFLEKNLIKIN